MLKDVMGAVLKAAQVARRPRQPVRGGRHARRGATTSTPRADEIRGRLTGNYDLGADLGETTFDGDQMRFFRDGQVNLPRRSHGIWFLAQYQRLGLPRRRRRRTPSSPTS